MENKTKNIELETKVQMNENDKKLTKAFKYYNFDHINFYPCYKRHITKILNEFDLVSKLLSAFKKGYFGIQIHINNPFIAQFYDKYNSEIVTNNTGFMMGKIKELQLTSIKIWRMGDTFVLANDFFEKIEKEIFSLTYNDSAIPSTRDQRFEQFNLLTETQNENFTKDLNTYLDLKEQAHELGPQIPENEETVVQVPQNEEDTYTYVEDTENTPLLNKA